LLDGRYTLGAFLVMEVRVTAILGMAILLNSQTIPPMRREKTAYVALGGVWRARGKRALHHAHDLVLAPGSGRARGGIGVCWHVVRGETGGFADRPMLR